MAKESQEVGRDEEVVEVALRLFLERGYDNTPMSLLARRLGLTKAGIYHHFASKEDLLFVVHKTAMKRQFAPVLAAAEKESDPERRLRAFLYGHACMLARDPAAMLMIREARRLSAKHLQEIKKTWRRGFDLVRDAIRQMQEQRRCPRDIDPTFAAFAAIGMASWIAYWFDPGRPDNAAAVAQTMTDIFMSGLLAAPARRSGHIEGPLAPPHRQRQSPPRKAEPARTKRRA